ncbi:methyltransferase [Algimonas arctica]|uniref:Methyltransferase n=1 Tax=Algimonas arctica TaxID=1479486 RepID=A0A8J3CR54_9PROT|nr:class I SAM-dependent methyltransferase [Algimonas arctica]GHA88801.1 methyltransferase [Algimonas arctica]
MTAPDIGQQYDEIASWWNERHDHSTYGLAQVNRALAFVPNGGKALDVGCGSGGRFVRRLIEQRFIVTGIDASAQMIGLARANHPDTLFINANIIDWKTSETYDFILVWDCLFHLPLEHQAQVLSKLCGLLSKNGVLIHSFGDGDGDHTDRWRGQTFRYSSMGITRNIEVLHDRGLSLLHLELDQFPENHVYAISRKL